MDCQHSHRHVDQSSPKIMSPPKNDTGRSHHHNFFRNGLLLLVLLFCISWATSSEPYDRCFQMEHIRPGCDFLKDPDNSSVDAENKTCYTTHGREPLRNKTAQWHPFTCHKASCSVQNEAFWLGQFPYETYIGEEDDPPEGHFLDKPPTHFDSKDAEEAVRRKYIYGLNSYWKSFKRMYDQGGAQLDLTWLEKLPTPDYIGEFENKLINDTRYPSPGLIVPLICDPRSYLTCEHSLRLSMDASPSTLEPTPTGSCQCHPLYSVEAEPKDRALPKGLQTIRGTSECHGRAMVPCEFGRWVWRAGQQTLNKTESINEDLNYWGEVWTHPPSGDREANFLNPEDLHDYTWDTINSTEKFIFTAKSSPCIANAKCELFYDFNERDSFRRGEIWQGFGIHPIIREMMLMSATKLCKCKFQEGFFHNSMHDCIKQEQ